MRRQILKSLLVGAAVLIGTELRAQQPAPPNLDAIPEKMPFGCSGGTGSQDEAICTAAAALVNK